MVPALPTRVAGVLLLAAGALGFAPPVTESNSEAAPPGIVANIEALVRAADADGTGDLSLPEFSSVVLGPMKDLCGGRDQLFVEPGEKTKIDTFLATKFGCPIPTGATVATTPCLASSGLLYTTDDWYSIARAGFEVTED